MSGRDKVGIKKLFGVALDPADDPWSLQLKQAWMAADREGLDWLTACLDPYDAVAGSLAPDLKRLSIELAGKFPVPSWLRPKPEPADLPLVTAHNMGDFFDGDGLRETIDRLKGFVAGSIFPAVPLMLGVDHSATAGVISALAERHGPENLGVIVIDQHFDAIPLSVRLDRASGVNPGSAAGMRLPAVPVGYSDKFCCGNFWAFLIDGGIVLPQNLGFIGVADYPGGETARNFRQLYLTFEERGCGFFPRERFEGAYIDELTQFIGEKALRPYIYVSLDVDVGAYRATYSARYMDRPGLSRENVLDIARTIAAARRSGKFEIAGLDIMEFNMHFLGIETPDGARDDTVALVRDFITEIWK
jgi:arginase family enzyme